MLLNFSLVFYCGHLPQNLFFLNLLRPQDRFWGVRAGGE